ncbi:3-dehydroquinate synthase [Sinanaerobacter sp. ZZT-01]|uniref:3-dehydroquinate synthase n=1 Tax=Sinanaerobacter sp. ZZT-01 TaxID=3111540 RepID=UPI002D765D2A|nr:3-dehydroquinate synthase [Sinanaerobacter sp. ZZT-01]WRR93139.1 3-dehydroquinate synthase [Sinanaerobacter sp. ZZT-01]
MEKQLNVSLGENSYSIHIKNGLLVDVGERIKNIYQGNKIFVLTDHNVHAKYTKALLFSLKEEGFAVHVYSQEPGESSKSLSQLQKIYEELLRFSMTRKDLLIVLGGGVVGDIGGFAAATYLRGIPFIQIPTSLLAQVDSSVGGKVAVDLPQGKNLVGNFYHPKAVFIDPLVLSSLPDKFFRDGMAEVIKYGCIKDKCLFDLISANIERCKIMKHIDEIIFRCCDLKRQLVEEDEKDIGNRMLLNFGHTIGHAIEQVQHYKGLSHGEAVAVGMYQITSKSEQLGLTETGTAEKIKTILLTHGLSVELPSLSFGAVRAAIMNDKKKMGDQLNVVLLKKIGESFLYKEGRTLWEI